MAQTAAKWTTPAPKYGPTSHYGECEVEACESDARTTCEKCKGEFCFGHGEHGLHSGSESGKR